LSDAPSVQDPRLQCFFMTFSKWFSNDPLSKSTTNVQIWSQSVQKLCFWLYEATLGSTCVVERFDDIENDKTKIFKRERMKNQPISKKKKSIFVKFSFAMRWKYHHLKLNPPWHYTDWRRRAPSHFVWSMNEQCLHFFHRMLRCVKQTSSGKDWKISSRAVLLHFRQFGCLITG